VHALVGENGAGKSTLMKILNGVYAMDSGEIRLAGEALQIRSPHDARKAGISMIFQEQILANDLTVAENIFLGMEPRGAAGFLDNRKLSVQAQEVLDRHNFPLSERAFPTRRTGRSRVTTRKSPEPMAATIGNSEMEKLQRAF
jgi:ABC-type sugar transport system ATPase subunit